MKKLFNLLLGATLITCAFSCKKSKTGPDPIIETPKKPCIITEYKTSDPQSYENHTLEYENGVLKTLTNKIMSLERKFFTVNNTILITTLRHGIQDQYDSVVLNDNGMIASIHTKYRDNTFYNRQIMQYGANDQLEKIILMSDDFLRTDSIMYEWKDGNMVREKHSQYEYEYTYHTDKLWAAGDYFSFQQFMEVGASYIKNKNLLKSRKTIPAPANMFIYNYDVQDTTIKSLQSGFWTNGDADTAWGSKMIYTYFCP